MSARVNVNNEMLTWAIARAGYELPAFIEKFPPLKKWLAGEKKPTLRQLEAFSKKVYLPFGFLFLPEPPQEELPIPFFRSNGALVETVSVNVYDTILLLQLRRESGLVLLSLLTSMNHHYLPNAINEFLEADEADAFLIAFTLADSLNRVLVTQEVSAPKKKSKIKMPDCCDAIGVTYTNTIKMFRQLGETFWKSFPKSFDNL